MIPHDQLVALALILPFFFAAPAVWVLWSDRRARMDAKRSAEQAGDSTTN